jgi:hypothetical protein
MTDIQRSREAASTDPKLNVFVSYSRADLEFADELVDGLDLMGYETTIDRHSIIEGEDWHARIGAQIGGTSYLMTDDTDTTRVEGLTVSMINLDNLLEAMRRGAAASVLILDTNFPVVDDRKTAR